MVRAGVKSCFLDPRCDKKLHDLDENPAQRRDFLKMPCFCTLSVSTNVVSACTRNTSTPTMYE